MRGPTKGSFYYLYVTVDIWLRKIIDWAVREEESMNLASQLIIETIERAINITFKTAEYLASVLPNFVVLSYFRDIFYNQ